MAEYIERSAALDKLDESLVRSIESGGSHEASGLVTAKCQIAAVPAADVVEVVRCKDCVFWNADKKGFSDECVCRRFSVLNVCDKYTLPTDFCSYGERREK